MSQKTTPFKTDKRFVRRERELKTIEAMIRLYCRGQAHPARSGLCETCGALLHYARRRLERCVFGDVKPTCANCVVHCYSKDRRAQVRAVMRWAGPRMMLHHPLLAILHMIDGRRPAPLLPQRNAIEKRR